MWSKGSVPAYRIEAEVFHFAALEKICKRSNLYLIQFYASYSGK